jgi:hypothetical protein
MTDLSWLSREAHNIHAIFNGLFYALITVFLLLGVFVEYFKWPLGQTPSFAPLVGRVMIAAILLHTYPDVSNLIADVSDAVSTKLINFNQFDHVRQQMGEKLHKLSWSWVSAEETILMITSYISFVLLHFSVFIADGFLIFTWTLLYVLSPVLIALYVLPATASATASLYRSLIEVSCWKIVWSVIGVLLWSTALGDIGAPGHDISFLSAVFYNLILAGSLLLTPLVVHALAGAGVAGLMKDIGSLSVGGIKVISTKMLAKGGWELGKRAWNAPLNAGARFSQYFPKLHRLNQSIPRMRVKKKPSPFVWPRKKKAQKTSGAKNEVHNRVERNSNAKPNPESRYRDVKPIYSRPVDNRSQTRPLPAPGGRTRLLLPSPPKGLPPGKPQ